MLVVADKRRFSLFIHSSPLLCIVCLFASLQHHLYLSHLLSNLPYTSPSLHLLLLPSATHLFYIPSLPCIPSFDKSKSQLVGRLRWFKWEFGDRVIPCCGHKAEVDSVTPELTGSYLLM